MTKGARFYTGCMDTTSTSSDKQLGLAIILGLFVVAGGFAMLLAPGDSTGAAGFAVAIIAGLALVAVFHLVDA